MRIIKSNNIGFSICLLFSYGFFIRVNPWLMWRIFQTYRRIFTMVEAVKEITFGNELIAEIKKPENQ